MSVFILGYHKTSAMNMYLILTNRETSRLFRSRRGNGSIGDISRLNRPGDVYWSNLQLFCSVLASGRGSLCAHCILKRACGKVSILTLKTVPGRYLGSCPDHRIS